MSIFYWIKNHVILVEYVNKRKYGIIIFLIIEYMDFLKNQLKLGKIIF